ncbi:Fatty acid hydroxylase domain-containing protein 2 [Mycena venus]|uniref:Fatty acid hydroxylase domain-containing protein 2 n=1 Tax=Mycena venus TaxID=2733690 RepID=A0A8H6XZ84_9AGAR|nr:Fatty acid hydroxylase domain-containing protein 2 [Mycena venus]
MTIASQWKQLLSILYVALPFVFPKFSARHKLHSPAKQPTPGDLWQCFIVVARNQTISTLLHAAMISFSARSLYRFDASLPGILEIFQHVALAFLIHEILFYYTYRLSHHPSLYPSIHKPHHRFVAPVALAAQYATMTEHLFSNVMPVQLPFMILNAHIVTFWIFLSLELVQTATDHSGFDFFAGKARDHDLHHEKSVVNFGSAGLMDWLHGTEGSSNTGSEAD